MHRTPTGTEIGGERPSGAARGLVTSFIAALTQTWNVRQTLWVLVLKEFKSRYRAQALGLFWSLAHPLVMMATVTFALAYVLRVPIPNFPVFYLIGSVFWHFFHNTALAGTGTLMENTALVKRTPFPRFLLPVASVFANLINFAMEWCLVFVFYFVWPDAYRFSIALIALPLLILIEVVMLVGVALTTSGLFVRYRDVYYMVTSILTVGFWVSPVLYSIEMAPEWLQPILRLNPLSGVMEGGREIIMHGRFPNPTHLLPGAISAVLIFVVGCLVFRKQNLRIADHV